MAYREELSEEVTANQKQENGRRKDEKKLVEVKV